MFKEKMLSDSLPPGRLSLPTCDAGSNTGAAIPASDGQLG